MQITGTNDNATLTSETKQVTEGNSASNLDTNGKLTVTDPDTGEAKVVAPANLDGTYGTFTVASDGSWTYTGNGAHNELTDGQKVTDQITVTSQDGTASGTIKVQITGTNDNATLSSSVKVLDETNSRLNIVGSLTNTDVDSAQTFQAGDIVGNYGTLHVNSDGNWSYLANSNHDDLRNGDYVSDTFTVKAADGTSTSVQVGINGTNDLATITSAFVEVKETSISTFGKLVVTDPDLNEARVMAPTQAGGTYGNFQIASDGTWTYVSNGVNVDLPIGEQTTEIFTVKSADGTATGVVEIIITGTEDGHVTSCCCNEQNPVTHTFADGNESITVLEDSGSTAGTLLSNISDPAGPVSVLSFTIAGDAATHAVGAPLVIAGQGTLVITANGGYSFTPAHDYNGNIPVITYKLTDGSTTDTSMLTITFTPVNDVTVITSSAQTGRVN